MRRPLDPLRSIKIKLGAVIVAAVAVTLVVFTIGVRFDIPTIVLGLIAGSLSLTMIQFLARGMTSPLRQMASAAAAMAEGDYSRRVTETSRDEVGELARAFNLMAAELSETDRIRRDLVANVSHDLRTPLSSLRATLENVIDGVTQPDEKSLSAMLAQVDRLGALVAQLLELSRLESGSVPFEPVELELDSVILASVRELGPDAERVDVAMPRSNLRVNGDPERMHRVLANLLHNALRHSPAQEHVSVKASSQGNAVVIEVADRGPGLDPGEETKVFERFYRGDSARSGDEGGAGLGLAIARWIVDLHGGSIRAERNEPTGCRMVVTLPTT
jgi:signal transduction histidine kinase